MPIVETEVKDAVARVTIRRGDGLNRLSVQALEELRDAARRLADEPSLAAVVVTGEPVFSAGVDLVEALRNEGSGMSMVELRHAMRLGPDLCRAWGELEAYTIAAIEGYCVGGAAALAAALDYRILGESAFLRLPEVRLGMTLSWQTIPRLVAQIGPARTKEYVIFGRRIPARDALAWGLCEAVAPDGRALEEAVRIAAEVERLPLLPVLMTKRAVNAAAHALADATSFMDRDQCLMTLQTPELREALARYAKNGERSPTEGEGTR